jgi:hypothetical protein
VTIGGKTIRGAFERIGDRILVTTVDAQKSVALDGDSEEVVARRTLAELFMAALGAPKEPGMSDLDKVVAWCRAERLKLIAQRDQLQAGKSRIHEMQDSRWVDVSFQSMERVENAIADIDKLLAQLNRRSARQAK